VINKNVTTKLKSTTHVSDDTFICYDMLFSNRLSLIKYFVA
jgi:hypothetical protein